MRHLCGLTFPPNSLVRFQSFASVCPFSHSSLNLTPRLPPLVPSSAPSNLMGGLDSPPPKLLEVGLKLSFKGVNNLVSNDGQGLETVAAIPCHEEQTLVFGGDNQSNSHRSVCRSVS